jgi:glycosyltransferase involved in cell wall biosynthesis
VQTPHMKQRLCQMSIPSSKITVWPFANVTISDEAFNSDGSFVCVSSGDAHKNIKNLILAWVLLAEDGCFPKLYLTISKSEYPMLSKWIDKQIHEWDLLISNLGVLPPEDIKKIYFKGSALIYPSLVESLGLPLIEAREAKVDIIAAELDYVRDVVSPAQTFNPNSPISIARSVKRYLGIPTTLIKLCNSEKLIIHLFS